MTDQRLPAINGDQGQWGIILNQYLSKEHYDTGVDNPANGGHKNVTIRAGTTSAAPLTFTSGTNLTTAAAGSMEYDGTSFYLTPSTTRKKIAIYDDTSGATGDIHYRDSSGNFVRLAAGGSNTLLNIASGLPAWTSTITGATISGSANTLSNIALTSLASAAYNTAATAFTLAEWDGAGRLSANAFVRNTTTAATAGSTTTLSISSTQIQVFTGTTTQTVLLPSASVLAGADYTIINQSTGAVTVQSSGANTIAILAANTTGLFVAQTAAPTTAAGWVAKVTAAGKVLTASNSLTLAGTDGTTMTFPSTSATIARTDAANTFTGVQTMTSPALTTPVLTGLSTGTGVASAATASTLAARDANANLSANALIPGFTTTATAAGTTTLTITSTQTQEFTGSTTQTVKLPTTSVAAGGQYTIINSSTGIVTVQSSGANTIAAMNGGTTATFTAVVATPTTAANWDTTYAASGSGNVVGPASATDNAIVRYDGTTGKLVQDSTATVSDVGSATFGTGVSGATATPTNVFLSNNFGNNTAGTAGNLKLSLFTGYGLGLSSGLLEIQSGGAIGAYVSGTRIMSIDGTGTYVPVVGTSTGAVVSVDGTQTLINKTISGSSNTLSNIALGSLATAAYNITPTASTLAEWDANKNLSANAVIPGFTTTVTSASLVTLTIASTGIQVFTGSTAQNVNLPTTGVVAGAQYMIINNSSAVTTVRSSGSNNITLMAASTTAVFTAVVATPTTAANWSSSYVAASTGTVTATGGALTANSVVLGAGTADTKVVAGVTTDGTSKLKLGVAGASVGSVDFNNATSGTINLAPPTGALGTSNLLLPVIASDTLVGKTTSDVLTNKTLTTPVINGTATGTGVSATPTASIISMWDANKNLSANAVIPGFTTTVTSASPVTLTISSTQTQVFTGSTAQTVKLPTTSVVAGAQYVVINNSSAVTTVQSSGANTITAMAANTTATFTAVVATPTTAANWSSSYVTNVATTFTSNVGDGSSTSIVITHNLGTRSVGISVYDAVTFEEVECDKFRTSTNTVTLTFVAAPATNAYVCVITGGTLSTTINSTDIADSTSTGRSVLTAASATAARTAISAISATSTDTLQNKTIDSTNTVATAALKIGSATQAFVATSESTTSTSYVDLTTTTDTVTLTIGSSGMALVTVYSYATNGGFWGYMGYAMSGANTAAASDSKALVGISNPASVASFGGAFSAVFLETGLTTGSTTFKAKYRAQNGSNAAVFANRRITVIPL